MSAIGIEVVRWFVFTDGRGGVRWGDDGRLTGLDEHFFLDLDAALSCARDSGVRLCLVLLDYAWLHEPSRRSLVTSASGPEQRASC